MDGAGEAGEMKIHWLNYIISFNTEQHCILPTVNFTVKLVLHKDSLKGTIERFVKFCSFLPLTAGEFTGQT